MKLVILATLIAVCVGAKLDRTYLPPPSAATAGGNSASLQTPLTKSSDEGVPSVDLPTGSYTNSFQGVVVDAAAPGIRASADSNQSGLGGPRDTYGSTNSKVGDAAFRGTVAGFRDTQHFGSAGSNGQISGINAGHNLGSFETKSERPQAFKDRNSNIVSYANDVSLDNYSYGFESDNGIAVGENGVANNGIQAQGGYSYQGDDGQVYKITYTADEGGYRPQGSHLPTPPPIPKEILVSLEQNAKEEAAGLVDDGSYDAQKYNAEGDYTHHNGGNTQYNGAQLSQPSKRPESDATASGTFINQNSQAFEKPNAGQLGNVGSHSSQSSFNGQSNQFSESQLGFNFASGNNQNNYSSQHKESSQALGGSQQSSSTSFHNTGHLGQTPGSQLTSHVGQTQSGFGSLSSERPPQNNQQGLTSQFGPQTPHVGSHQNGLTPQFGTQNVQAGSQPNKLGSTSQFGIQPTKPSFGQGFTNTALNVNQLLQFGNQVFKPQSSFGQQINGVQNTLSSEKPHYNNEGYFVASQNQESKKPLFSTFGSNKPSTNGQISGNTFGSLVTNNSNTFSNVPNRFGGGYLPPLNANKPTYTKPQTAQVPTVQEPNKNSQNLNAAVPSTGTVQGVPLVSVNQPGFVSQSAIPVNSFQFQTSSKPNQFNFNTNNSPTSQEASSSNSLLNLSQNTGSNSIVSGIIPQSKPTAVPETELTTPLQPNEKPSYSQASQFNSQSTPSFITFGSKPLNNQVQAQFVSQNNVPTSQQTGQTLSTSLPSSLLQGNSQTNASPTPPAFPDQQGSSNKQPQFPSNKLTQNQQNNGYYSTQKPFSQGPDNSYYYNQPSKPFNTPEARPEGSRFPSTPSYQSNGIAPPQNSQFLNQHNGLPSYSKFPSTSSFATVAPTSSSHFSNTQGSSSSNYNNGITQAAISPFPSVSPTSSTQFGTTQNGQFVFKPNLSQTQISLLSQSGKPTTSQQPSATQAFPSKPASSFGQKPSASFTQNQIQFGQSSTVTNNRPTNSQGTNIDTQTSSTLTEEFQGTVYEYNKPAEALPAPTQTGSSYSETDSSSKPQIIQTQGSINNILKPQFGSQQTQFAQNSHGSQSQQTSSIHNNNKPQFGTQSYKPFGSSPSTNTQFGQNSQTSFGQTFQHNTQSTVQPGKPNGAASINSSQFGQASYGTQSGAPGQQNAGSQLGYQTAKPFGSTSIFSPFGQNTQQIQSSANAGQLISSQHIPGSQGNVQSFKPFGAIQPTNTQQSSTITNNRPTNSQGTNIDPQTSSTLTQEYQGTVYEYNKPAETLPAPTQTGSSSNGTDSSSKPQIIQTQGSINNILKPQFGSQQTQFAQNSHGSQSQQTSSIHNNNKPQFGTQSYKPFGSSPSTNTQFGQNSQTSFGQTFQHNTQSTVQPGKPNGAASINSSQFGQASYGTQSGVPGQQNAGSQLGYQTAKPFGSTSIFSPFGQNTQQIQSSANAGQLISSQQIPGSQGNVQSFKPFGAIQPTNTQLGQNEISFGSQNSQQVFGGVQTSKPFGSVTNTHFSQATQSQGSHSSGLPSNQQNVQGSQFPAHLFKPSGNSGPQIVSSKPQLGAHIAQTQFTSSQSSPQSFGISQTGSQPAANGQSGTLPTKPLLATNPIHGSPGIQQPLFGQNTGSTQGNKPFGQTFQGSQFGAQTQFGLNENTSPAQASGISSSHFGQTSGSIGASQTPQSYKPSDSASSSSFQSQQITSQSTQSQSGSGASGVASIGTQPFKPIGHQGSKNQSVTPTGSSTGLFNVSQPSQAFGSTTQNQFTGFQATQSFSAQSVAGKGEEFGGPREPPRFDTQTGYHY